MKVLCLEDRASIFDRLEEKLKNEGYSVLKAYQISDAMDHFEEQEIDFLIVDLRVIPTGFEVEQLRKSKMGSIAGWVFLEEIVFPQKPELKKRTIVYSEHINDLRRERDLSQFQQVSFLHKSKKSFEDVLQLIIEKTEHLHR